MFVKLLILVSVTSVNTAFFFGNYAGYNAKSVEEEGRHVLSLTMCQARMSGMRKSNMSIYNRKIPIPVENGRRIVYASYASSACPKNVKYRTANGECNNMLKPAWGKANTRFKRFLKARYSDGIGRPRIFSKKRILFYRFYLPSARQVSTCIHTAKNMDSIHSVLLMQWGQFLDHDITETAIEDPGSSGCCNNVHRWSYFIGQHPDVFQRNGKCFPILITDIEDIRNNGSCLAFVRSRAINPNFNTTNRREQQNLLTSFVDASNVYGSSKEKQKELRGRGGKMKTSKDNLLPAGDPESCMSRNSPFCFDAGDGRVNVFPGLTALHLAFVRYHNDIVDELKKHNPKWNGEKLFQETRKIIGALIQRITYNEYLSEILSKATLKKYKLKPGSRYAYNDSINPSIASSFSTAAFRYGHSLIPDFLVIGKKKILSRELFLNPQFIFTQLTSVVENILSNPAEMSDRFLTDEITNHLFEGDNGAMDLGALNIQRGRDHGLPPYNYFRSFCGLKPISSFYDDAITGSEDLESTYWHVDDIDLFVGGMLEKPMRGSVLGPVLNCLIGRQFRDLKFGDSFWYETSDKYKGFTKAQLASINKMSLSQILCQVFDLKEIQRDPFRVANQRWNRKLKCKKFERMNLSPWYVN